MLGCLNSLAPGLERQLIREVIVTDGGTDDGSLDYAEDAGTQIIRDAKGRGQQLRAGVEAAQGGWLLFLHADTFLEKNWADQVISLMASSPDKAGYFQLSFRSDAREARWLEARANRRAKWFGLPYGDQGLVLSRTLYNQIGGVKDLPIMEDVDLVRRLGKSRLAALSARAFTSADKYERHGWRKRAYSNAILLTRYLLGASPEKLADQYYRARP